jgi:signal transduction histidine kinase
MLKKNILIWLFFLCSKLYSQDAGIGQEYYLVVQKKIDSLEQLLKKSTQDTNTIYLLNQISKHYRVIDEFQAFVKADEALKLAKKINYWKGQTQSYINLGFVSNSQGFLEQAIDYYQQGATLAEKHQIFKDYIYCLNGIAIIHWNRKEFQKALDIFEKILKIQIQLNLLNDVATTHNNMGVIFNEFKKYDTALEYLFKSYRHRTQSNDEEKMIATLNNIGIAFLGKNQPDTALYYSLKSLDLAKKYYQKRRIKEATLTLSEIYAQKRQFEPAYQFLLEHKIVLDSIEKQDKADIIAQEKRRRDIQQKEEQIRILEQNNQLRNIIYVILTAFLITTIFVILRRAKRKQRFYELMEEKNLEISNQKSIIEQQNAELLALNENLENLVEERTRKLFEANLLLQNANKDLDTYVYRFAHDFRGPLATMLGLTQLGKIESSNVASQDIFDKIFFTATQMDTLLHKLSTLYQVAHHIVEYQKFNLYNTCKKIVSQQAQMFGIQENEIDFNYAGMKEIFGDPYLIRVCLEHILENALLFHKQKPIKLVLKTDLQGDKAIMISLRDDGQGIEKEHLPRVFEMFFRANVHSKGNGMGLHIVQKAIEKLQGAVHVESEKENFTQIDLIIPSYEELRKHQQQ